MEIAHVYHDFAKAFFKKKEFKSAIEYMQRALDIYWQTDYEAEKRADVCIKCSDWMVKAERMEDALQMLWEAEDIYECTFGLVDKKTCKIKRDVALLLLKANKYDEALEEVIGVEE